MAILVAPKTTGSNWQWDLKGPWENGTYPAILVDIIERENVIKSFKNDKGEMQEKEMNTARFLFAYLNDDEEVCFAQTYEMNQTASTKGHLIKMLASIRGKMPPLDGSYDYCSEIGTKCQITIEVKEGRKSGEKYGAIVGFSAVPKKLVGDCPDLEEVVLPEDRRTERPEAPSKRAKRSTEVADEEDPF